MDKIINWIKNNKLLSVLVLLVVSYLYSNGVDIPVVNKIGGGMRVSEFAMQEDLAVSSSSPRGSGGLTPQLDIDDRKVITNSNLSLVVSDVAASIKSITVLARERGGYMVDSSVSSPEGLSNGNITIRVPSSEMENALEQLRSMSVKVVSENIRGKDITDEYVNVEARLNTLQSTKVRYEEILNGATDVDDILRVTQLILNIQDQIDALIGRLDYLNASANSSLITVYLSTDEFELPYTPDQPWRPGVIFKTAVRSLVGAFQSLGTAVVWLAVYAVIWVPALFVYRIIKKKRANLPKQES